jgi:hypothetical protein
MARGVRSRRVHVGKFEWAVGDACVTGERAKRGRREERSERTSGWGRELKGGGSSGWNIRGEDSVAFSRGRGCVWSVTDAWTRVRRCGWRGPLVSGVGWMFRGRKREAPACRGAAFSDRWSGEEGSGARLAEEWREMDGDARHVTWRVPAACFGVVWLEVGSRSRADRQCNFRLAIVHKTAQTRLSIFCFGSNAILRSFLCHVE